MNAIATHETVFRAPFRQFHENKWLERQGSTPPEMQRPEGTVYAYVNHGRWIAECPSGCGHAIVASISNPYFLCTICGPKTNDGKWFRVAFPANRTEIETVLLSRPRDRSVPVSMPYMVKTRNWKRGESVEDLRKENAAKGLRR